MARSLQEILEELNAAEKEYADKCKKYGIEEKHKKKKEEEPVSEENSDEQAAEPQIQEDTKEAIQ